MKIGYTLLLLLIANYCISQTNETVTYTKANYSIQYPTSWQLDTATKMGASLFIFSPLENNADNFKENVNIMIQDLGNQKIDLEKYKQISDKQIKQMGVNAKVIQSIIVTTSKQPYYRVAYSIVQQGVKIQIVTKCVIVNNKAYLATFSGDYNKFEQYKSVCKEIINSFYVK
jgi:PsbP